MARKPDCSAYEETAFTAMKHGMAERLLPLPPEAVYDATVAER